MGNYSFGPSLCYIRQDGPPAHFHIEVRNQRIPKRMAGARGAHRIPTKITRFNPSRFYLWGVLKDIVYAVKPETLQELRGEIQNVCKNIPVETIQYCSQPRCTTSSEMY